MVNITRTTNLIGLVNVVKARLTERYPEIIFRYYDFRLCVPTGERKFFRPQILMVAQYTYHIRGEYLELITYSKEWEKHLVPFFEGICDEFNIPEMKVISPFESPAA